MYIENHKKNLPQKIDLREKPMPDRRQTEQKNKFDRFLEKPTMNLMIEEPEEKLIAEHSADVLVHWKAPEYETYERDKKWYTWITLALIAIISYAVFTNSPIMAITFILIGVTGYIHIHREPEIFDFMITYDGIVAGRQIYDYDNIRSFWIFYEPEGKKVISLHTQSHLAPFIHIPIENEDPVDIREVLLEFMPEEKHNQGLIELFERILRF
jgi:hypothetical protein